MLLAAAACAIVIGCAKGASPPGGAADGNTMPALAPEPSRPRADRGADRGSDHGADRDAGLDADVREPRIDPDGNDDEEDPGSGRAPGSGRWEKVGTAPLALTRICDLTPFRGSLYAAHAHTPLGTDGATITRFTPAEEARPFRVAFDWNRPGEPAKGGGAGQGFLRVHAIGGRLFVADADPPYAGLGLVDWGAEGYVFVSDDKGVFASPRAPGFRPPGAPELRAGAGSRAGAGVLPRAYHVIDVIRYRGALYASTGSVPPKERAWKGPSPGALHRASEDGARWSYEVDYPYPWRDGVWRLTFLVRFRDRLYAGIQDYDGRDPHDFVVFTPTSNGDAGPVVLQREDAHPTRITRVGASGTLRWWVDTRASPARLYWLAWTRDGIVLRVTTDGDHWAAFDLRDAGLPTDVTRYRDAVVVLTDRGLHRIDGHAVDGPFDIAKMGGVAEATVTPIAPVLEDTKGAAAAGKKSARKSPFEVSDFFCVAPLAVLNDVLYAGGQRGGSLYRLQE